jgi:CIC family chloride channel protein
MKNLFRIRGLIRKIIFFINHWRKGALAGRNFLFLASILVGLVVGFVAFLLKNMVHGIGSFLRTLSNEEKLPWLYLFYPMFGILLTVFIVEKIRNGQKARGISQIIQAVSRRSANMNLRNIYRPFVNALITVGFGGSVGLEAPVAVTGSAIGSNIAKVFLLSQKERIILLACGAAAGIAAMFNTPIGGVLFAMEVLLIDFSVPTFIPLLLSAAAGAVVAKELGGKQMFVMQTVPWEVKALPFYIALGILAGLISIYFTRTYYSIEIWLYRYRNRFVRAVVGGGCLGTLIFLFPWLYGEGYDTIAYLLQGNLNTLMSESNIPIEWLSDYYIFAVIPCLLFLKVMATGLTIHSGGGGGIFAPSLFTGALLGLTFVVLFRLTGVVELNLVNFIAAGMAGVLAGVVHAPLTGIFLIAELTGGYTLFVPLMVVSASAYFVSKAISPYSLYTQRLASKGFRIHNKEEVLLQGIFVSDIMEAQVKTANESQSLADLVNVFTETGQTVIPIVNNMGRFSGIVDLNDFKSLLLNIDAHSRLQVRELMHNSAFTLTEFENIHAVLKKFDSCGQSYLPVLKTDKSLAGLASKSKLMDLLRESITDREISME